MEALAAIGLIGNVVQFVDFSSKLVSGSIQLYRSAEGALEENIDTETVAKDLVLLNGRLKDSAASTSDGPLKNLCESCQAVAAELLQALAKAKVQGQRTKWKSIKKALQSVWNKEHIAQLDGRLARIREELNLQLTVSLRYGWTMSVGTTVTTYLLQGRVLSLQARAFRPFQEHGLKIPAYFRFHHRPKGPLSSST